MLQSRSPHLNIRRLLLICAPLTNSELMNVTPATCRQGTWDY